MKIAYLLPGAMIAALGFATLFGLLASVSALSKSKQLGAMAILAAGEAGGARRLLFFASVLAMVLGTCGAFGGVAASDHERARACQRTCVDRGYAQGRVGPAQKPDRKRPGPTCGCSGGASASTPLEVHVDDLVF